MNKKFNFAFFGSSELSIGVLNELRDAGLLPSLIIAPPDKPKGRNMVLASPLTKEWAEENDIVCIQPKDLKNIPEMISDKEWDFFVVASYGSMLLKGILNIPSHGVLNVHPSLLPKLRGASPIQSAILKDLQGAVGVTVMLVDEEMDHGPILAQASVELDMWPPKASVLEELLAHEGGMILAGIIPLWMEGKITPEEQNHNEATNTEKISKEDGSLDLNADPYKNFLKIQAYDKWPGTHFYIENNSSKIRVKIADAQMKSGELIITRVVPEGKNEMSYSDFIRNIK